MIDKRGLLADYSNYRMKNRFLIEKLTEALKDDHGETISNARVIFESCLKKEIKVIKLLHDQYKTEIIRDIDIYINSEEKGIIEDACKLDTYLVMVIDSIPEDDLFEKTVTLKGSNGSERLSPLDLITELTKAEIFTNGALYGYALALGINVPESAFLAGYIR